MTGFEIRVAGRADARDIAEMLSGVLAAADTSAIVGPVDGATISEWMAMAPARSSWRVAEAESGEIMGLQWIEPTADLPTEACSIATFVLPGRQQLGIGSALFAETERTARALGYRWINATIRADNEGGLIYYQSRGFRVWKRTHDVPLASGRLVDRISTRYDLD